MDTMLTEMDFNALGNGDFTASPEAVRNAIGNPRVYVLDVRTDVEGRASSYPFASHIPLSELPDRLDEIPTNKMVLVVAGTAFESAVGLFYLRQSGLEEVKSYVAGAETMATALKPGPLFMAGMAPTLQKEKDGCGCCC